MQVFGASASYLLTGREGGVQLADAAEQVLIDSYRRCSADAKRHLIQTAALLAAGHGVAADQGQPKIKQRQKGDGSMQIGAVFQGPAVKLPAGIAQRLSKRRTTSWKAVRFQPRPTWGFMRRENEAREMAFEASGAAMADGAPIDPPVRIDQTYIGDGGVQIGMVQVEVRALTAAERMGRDSQGFFLAGVVLIAAGLATPDAVMKLAALVTALGLETLAVVQQLRVVALRGWW